MGCLWFLLLTRGEGRGGRRSAVPAGDLQGATKEHQPSMGDVGKPSWKDRFKKMLKKAEDSEMGARVASRWLEMQVAS